MLLLLVASTAFADRARVVADRPERSGRVLVPDAGVRGWRALRDRETGAVAQLWGGSIAAVGAVGDPAIAARAARAFVAAHLDVLAPGASIDDFAISANRRDGALRTVTFRQTWRGLRVVGGGVYVVFGHDRLFAAGSTALPEPSVKLPGMRRATRARLDRARAWFPGVTMASTGERVVLPIVHGANDIEYQIADAVDARAASGERWTVYVAPDGAPLARDLETARATGTLRFDVPERRPGGTRLSMPAASVGIAANGSAETTGSDGSFSWNGNQPATVVPSVVGTFVQVTDAAGSPATASLTAQPGGNVDWSLASDEHGDAQLTAFVYASIAKARARQIAPGLAWLDQPIAVSVDEVGACNAFSSGDDLHFFAAGDDCENTARVTDIVLHEFGHSLHFQSIIPDAGAYDLSLSEGMSDFFAANITGDPGIGRGLHFDDVAVRDLDPVGFERRYPEDLGGDTHIAGLIVGGALWDLRTRLVAELGDAAGIAAVEAIYLGILRRAPDIPGSYLAALIADDDDGDLGNGTPHQCAIERAFAPHALVPGVEVTQIDLPAVDGRDISLAVTPPVDGTCALPRVTSVDLEWQLDDQIQTIVMTANGDTWSAAIPPQPDGTVVTYRVIAHLDDGTEIVRPDNPADPRYQLFVGAATPIFCERFDADPGWMQAGAGTWEWASPRGIAGDPPMPFTGTAVLGTDLGSDPFSSGRYPAGSTSIATPTIDASAFGRVHLQFRRWLAIEDGAHDVAAVSIAGSDPLWTNATGVDHRDREWRFVDLELPPGTFSLEWSIAADDDGVELGGWSLDDVCVVGLDGPDPCPDCAPFDDPAGCCSTGGGGGDARGALVLGLGVLVGIRRRRRSPAPERDL